MASQNAHKSPSVEPTRDRSLRSFHFYVAHPRAGLRHPGTGVRLMPPEARRSATGAATIVLKMELAIRIQIEERAILKQAAARSGRLSQQHGRSRALE